MKPLAPSHHTPPTPSSRRRTHLLPFPAKALTKNRRPDQRVPPTTVLIDARLSQSHFPSTHPRATPSTRQRAPPNAATPTQPPKRRRHTNAASKMPSPHRRRLTQPSPINAPPRNTVFTPTRTSKPSPIDAFHHNHNSRPLPMHTIPHRRRHGSFHCPHRPPPRVQSRLLTPSTSKGAVTVPSTIHTSHLQGCGHGSLPPSTSKGAVTLPTFKPAPARVC